jgi:hypothetical protein
MHEDKLIKLTDTQAVQIAKIAYPKINWIVKPQTKMWHWKGIDLIEKGAEEHKEKHNFQIDFRENQEETRFRYYDEKSEQTIVSPEVKQKIYNYIQTL